MHEFRRDGPLQRRRQQGRDARRQLFGERAQLEVPEIELEPVDPQRLFRRRGGIEDSIQHQRDAVLDQCRHQRRDPPCRRLVRHGDLDDLAANGMAGHGGQVLNATIAVCARVMLASGGCRRVAVTEKVVVAVIGPAGRKSVAPVPFIAAPTGAAPAIRR